MGLNWNMEKLEAVFAAKAAGAYDAIPQERNITNGLKNKISSNTIMPYFTLDELEEKLAERNLSPISVATYIRNLKTLAKLLAENFDESNIEEDMKSNPREAAMEIAEWIKGEWDDREDLRKETNEDPENLGQLFSEEEIKEFTQDLDEVFPSTSVTKARVAALLVALSVKNLTENEKKDDGRAQKLIDWLRTIAVVEQKAYHKKVLSKNPKEEANWVTWNKIKSRAALERSNLAALVEKRGYPKFAINSFAKNFNTERAKAKAAMSPEFLAVYNEVDTTDGENYRKMLMLDITFRFFQPYTEGKGFNKPFKTALFNALIATIYTELPPRRLDYNNLMVLTKDQFDNLCIDEEEVDKMDNPEKYAKGEEKNEQSEIECSERDLDDYVVYVIPKLYDLFSSKSFFFFGRNSGKSKQKEDLRVDNISSRLRILMGYLYGIQVQSRDGGKFIPEELKFYENGTEEIDFDLYDEDMAGTAIFDGMTPNALGKRITKVFSGKYGGTKKTISVGLLRKIYISSMFKGDTAKKAHIARLMNHSVKIQQYIYNKEGNITPDEFMKIESNLITLKK